MGFKDWFKIDPAVKKHNAMLGMGNMLQGYELTVIGGGKGNSFSTNTKNLHAEVTTPEKVDKYISAGRVVGGTLLFGPIGLVAGVLAKKDPNRVYITITKDEQLLGMIDVKPKDIHKAHQFAQAINRSAQDPENPGE